MKAICMNCSIEFSYKPSQSRGKYCSNKCQLEYQRNNIVYKNYLEGKIKNVGSIRKFLIKDKGYLCEECKIIEHNNKPITLQIDHMDGNPDNNHPSNLRFLCPNCHSQTETYKGGNKNRLKNDNRNNNLRKKYATLKQLKELEQGTVD
jgi:Zn finger protein HypA/HybF involved in hydrogenase expression